MEATELFRLALRSGFLSALGVGLVSGVARHLQRTDYRQLWPRWAPILAGATALVLVVLFPFGWEWIAESISLGRTGRLSGQAVGDPTHHQLVWLITTIFVSGVAGLVAGPIVRDRVWE